MLDYQEIDWEDNFIIKELFGKKKKWMVGYDYFNTPERFLLLRSFICKRLQSYEGQEMTRETRIKIVKKMNGGKFRNI